MSSVNHSVSERLTLEFGLCVRNNSSRFLLAGIGHTNESMPLLVRDQASPRYGASGFLDSIQTGRSAV